MHYLLAVYLLSYTSSLGKAVVEHRERLGLPARPQGFSTCERPVFSNNRQQLRHIFNNYTEKGLPDNTAAFSSKKLVHNPLVMTYREQLSFVSHSHKNKARVMHSLKQMNGMSKWKQQTKAAPPTLTAHAYGRLSLDQLRLFAKQFNLCPQIIDQEELATFYRYMQSVEWSRWMSKHIRSRRGCTRHPDLLHHMLEHGNLPMPPSQHSLALSFRYLLTRRIRYCMPLADLFFVNAYPQGISRSAGMYCLRRLQQQQR